MRFKFDEASGLPVDPETGYYFVPDHNLFFDATSQCYLTFQQGECLVCVCVRVCFFGEL